MFDPYFIGDVERPNVKVLSSFGHSGAQFLRTIILIQDNYYALILKPNKSEERDQIVIDRLKHVFNLTPMNTFGLRLDFIYVQGAAHNVGWFEYFAFASDFKSIAMGVTFPHIEAPLMKFEFEQRVKLCMILMFRYIIGDHNTKNDNILIVKDDFLSISEMRFSSSEMDSRFSKQFEDFEDQCWKEARHRLMKGVLLDNIRGILLQVQNPTKDISRKSPKGKLSIPARRIMCIIEERIDVVRSSTLNVLKLALRVKLE